MKSPTIVLVALLSLFCSSFADAQSGLGRRERGSSSGTSSGGNDRQDRGTPPVRGSSSNSSGVGRSSGSSSNNTPPVRSSSSQNSGSLGRPSSSSSQNRGNSGGSLGRPERSSSGVGQSRGGYGTNPGSNSGLGRPSQSSGSTQNRGNGGSVLGRPDRNSGNSDQNRGNSGSVLGRPDRTSGSTQNRGNSGSVLGRPSQNSGSTQNRGNSGSVLGRPDRSSNNGSGTNNSGANGSGSVLGRPDRVNGSSSSGSILGRPQRGTGNGVPIAGSTGSHNVGIGKVKPGTVFDVPRVNSDSKIRREGYRENRIESNRYRNGYCHYDNNWSDNRFFYPYYGFTWYSGNTVCSPFYYYYHLPAYVNVIRVHIGPLTWVHCSTPYIWTAPRYDRYGYNDDRYANFDYAVYDIRNAFERRDMRSMTHLIPTRGRVEIDMAYDNQYTLDGADFYDMMRDLVEGTQTLDYRILNVYREGSRATVEAEHVYTDPWGREEAVRHVYGLRHGGRGYEITYFRTDR